MAPKKAASPAKSEKPISEAAARIIEKDIEFLMQVILSLPKSEIKWDTVANNLGCTRNAASKRWVRIMKRWEPATSLEATHEEDEEGKEGE